MEQYEGNLLSGEWDVEASQFVLRTVKQIEVQSVLSETQFKRLQDYLAHHEIDESVMITLYDQIPIIVPAEQRGELDRDIQHISEYWKDIK